MVKVHGGVQKRLNQNARAGRARAVRELREPFRLRASSTFSFARVLTLHSYMEEFKKGKNQNAARAVREPVRLRASTVLISSPFGASPNMWGPAARKVQNAAKKSERRSRLCASNL